MSYPWELDGWETREQSTFPLEWKHGTLRYRLGRINGTWWVDLYDGQKWRADHRLTDHEAACLIDNFLTAWLRERDVLLHPSIHRGDFLVKRWSPTGQGGWLLGEGGWHDTGDEAKSARFATEREAVAAAVDAVLKEKK